MAFDMEGYTRLLAAAKPGATPYWRWDRGRLLLKRRRLMKSREDSWTMRAREFHRRKAGLAKRNAVDLTVDDADGACGGVASAPGPAREAREGVFVRVPASSRSGEASASWEQEAPEERG